MLTYLQRDSLCARRRSNISRRFPPSETPQSVDEAAHPPVQKPSNDEQVLDEKLLQEIDSFETLIEDGEGVMSRKTSFSDLSEELAKDFAELSKSNLFSDKTVRSSTQKSVGTTVASGISTARNLITKVLIADFFVVVAFLVWFLFAAALQSTYPVVLERFQDVFQPVVVPALTVLMVGSVASGVAEKLQSRQLENL